MDRLPAQDAARIARVFWSPTLWGAYGVAVLIFLCIDAGRLKSVAFYGSAGVELLAAVFGNVAAPTGFFGETVLFLGLLLPISSIHLFRLVASVRAVNSTAVFRPRMTMSKYAFSRLRFLCCSGSLGTLLFVYQIPRPLPQSGIALVEKSIFAIETIFVLGGMNLFVVLAAFLLTIKPVFGDHQDA